LVSVQRDDTVNVIFMSVDKIEVNPLIFCILTNVRNDREDIFLREERSSIFCPPDTMKPIFYIRHESKFLFRAKARLSNVFKSLP